MNELQSIVAAAGKANLAGESALLATVVRVRGSAYRRPGARMLITEAGWQAGGISGGCLESDIVRRAWWLTRTGEPVIVTYDSTITEDGDTYSLGCNGIIEVMLERLKPDTVADPVAFVAECLNRRRSGVLATIIASNTKDTAVGQRLLLHEGNELPSASSLRNSGLASLIQHDARRILATGEISRTITYAVAAGSADVFLEVIAPPIPLLICGAGSDAAPLARMANLLGWEVTVFDPNPGLPPQSERFPAANSVLSGAARDLPHLVPIDSQTLAVIMTHNVARDTALLHALLASPARYIGMLGPRNRTERILATLEVQTDNRLHGPVGLDIGADNPETIALSILAEMQATLAGRGGGYLRDAARTNAAHEGLIYQNR